MGKDIQDTITLLAVADLARAVGFYQRAFGLERAVDTPVYVELPLREGHTLGLYQREGFAKNVGQTPIAAPSAAITSTELYLRVGDLDAAIARLERADARLLSPRAPRPWGEEAAYYADPDGNVVAVARRG